MANVGNNNYYNYCYFGGFLSPMTKQAHNGSGDNIGGDKIIQGDTTNNYITSSEVKKENCEKARFDFVGGVPAVVLDVTNC